MNDDLSLTDDEREAWRDIQALFGPKQKTFAIASALEKTLARAMKAEHEKDCENYSWLRCTPECPKADADWLAEARRELGGK